ncbi:hypothetical protein RG836_10075 [Pseudomonas sp. SZMC_28357]|jgi:hypothetical protein|uniref:hypothetical protein n=1 Tax=Pseudomonas sp. SZMC_28357 TaxID=3074380 RepID=UPI0028716229|nr:hypothetical protein [Pseudomonas sp. SZMC_28357]MDR9751797.1 hypothetical protein [Pseudomonas sp. SZMC_28357]
MSSFSKKAAVLLLAAVAGCISVSAFAAKATAKEPAAQKVSILGGKFTFTLPKGFTVTALPGGDAASGTAGATGTMYTNATSKTVVIVAENTIPGGVTVKDNDTEFLDAALVQFIEKQSQALPDFNKLSEKSMSQRGAGLGLRQVDSTATQGGGPTLDTTLLTASGTRTALVQVVSRASDKVGHEALVKQILAEK